MINYQLLDSIVRYIEASGSKAKYVHIHVDEELLHELNQQQQQNYSLAQLHQAANDCLALRWLAFGLMPNDNLRHLQITAAGQQAHLEWQQQHRPPVAQTPSADNHQGLSASVPWWVVALIGVGVLLLAAFSLNWW